ncbi:histidine kinase [Kitasatospora sp. NPDC002040]|uniref:sensor histidine kinase n=1 Tax=Kitasatospora sp. NPDC002040 TaxID=3154661 RepID=UPI00331EB972
MAERDTRRSIRAMDVVLAAGAAAYQVRDLVLSGSGHGPLGPVRGSDVGVWVALSALLLVRRHRPYAVAALAVAADLVSFYPAAEAVALFTIGARTVSRPVRVAVLAASAVLHAAVYLLGSSGGMPRLIPHYALFCAAPLLLGLYVAARGRHDAMLRGRMETMERERVLVEERARSQERRGIAREMHDVVAHGVSHMVFRAGALQMVADSRGAPWAAREADTLQTLGRGVLGELRTVLGLLGGGVTGERVPLPTAADLPALLDRVRADGVPVRLRQAGETDRLEPRYGRTLYRVVQEALTNVARHAPGAGATVDVLVGAESLTVQVTNGPPGHRPGPRDADGPEREGCGRGLLGMRERVELLGGTVRYGPTPAGGFRVRAALDLTHDQPPQPRRTGT